MNLCTDCLHSGVCLVRAQLEKGTILEFPDGKVAVVDMEHALKSCDHYTSNAPHVYGAGLPAGVQSNSLGDFQEEHHQEDHALAQDVSHSAQPPAVNPNIPPPRWVPGGSAPQAVTAADVLNRTGSPAFIIPDDGGASGQPPVPQQPLRPRLPAVPHGSAGPRRISLQNLPSARS